jgi:hypothetical protein
MRRILAPILLALTFTVMFSSTSFAEWKKVGENVAGTTRYVDFERTRKHGGYVYYWSLGNYLKPTPQGYLSGKSYTQGDCNLFRTKTLTEHYFTDQMGRGTLKVWTLTEFQKRWLYAPPDSAMEVTLKSVCEYTK